MDYTIGLQLKTKIVLSVGKRYKHIFIIIIITIACVAQRISRMKKSKKC